MKRCYLGIALFPLFLVACGEGGTPSGQATGATSDSQGRLSKEAKEWAQETKELGQAAWDVTKEAAGEAAVKSKEMYDTVKTKAGEYDGAAKESTKDTWGYGSNQGNTFFSAISFKMLKLNS